MHFFVEFVRAFGRVFVPLQVCSATKTHRSMMSDIARTKENNNINNRQFSEQFFLSSLYFFFILYSCFIIYSLLAVLSVFVCLSHDALVGFSGNLKNYKKNRKPQKSICAQQEFNFLELCECFVKIKNK